MTEETQTGFRTEGQPAFPVLDTESGNSAASSPETPTTEQTPSPTGEQQQAQTPPQADGTQPEGEQIDWSKFPDFTKHPRWQEREEEWKERFNGQEQRHVEELNKIRTEMEQKYGKPNASTPQPTPQGQQPQGGNQETPEQVPPWFGGDQEAWDQFRAWNDKNLESRVKSAREGWENENKQKTEAEQTAIKEATDFMNTETTRLESDKAINPQGLKIDKNKLMKIVEKFGLVDPQGRWNWAAGFEFYKNHASAGKLNTLDDRKEVAAATTSENRAEPQPATVATSDDFKKERPW